MEEHHVAIPFLREGVIFLVASGLIVPIFHHYRISSVLGYLIVGWIIGPFGLGLLVDTFPWLEYVVITHVEGISHLAELGVIFLLFVIGLELSLDRLWAMRRLVFGLGAAQVLITATIITIIARFWGNPPTVAIILGACLALSSTAIVMQLLMERRLLGTPLGRSSFAILLFQDLAVVPILFMLGVFGNEANGSQTDVVVGLTLALGQAAVVVGLIYLLGRVALRPLFAFVSRTGSPEMFMAAILLVVIAASAATGLAGLSMALGAFLAGVLLAGTEFRHEIEVDIEPFKGLLLGLFFMTVGMGIDYRVIAQEAFWIISAVIGMYALKATIVTGLSLAYGLPRHVAVESGLLLGQGGEFAFVVIGLALTLGLMPADTAQFMLIVTGITMMLTPIVAELGKRVAAATEHHPSAEHHTHGVDAFAEGEGHIILAGFGRVGRMLARILDREHVTFLALDLDGPSVGEQRSLGRPVFYGDASRIELLKRAGAQTAAAVVVTMDDPDAAERVVSSVRSNWPALPIYARARDRQHARRLLGHGATDVVPETVESSLQLSLRVLRGIGTSEEVSAKRISLEREAALDELKL